jgi:hypothetical protein
MSILARVPTGFGKPFPVRDLSGLNLLKSDEVKEGGKVLEMKEVVYSLK